MTQSQEILEYLKTGKWLSPIEALEKFGSFRLGARIFDLRKEGYSFDKRQGTNGKKRWAEYRLKPVTDLFSG
jgi:hypothetical protein